MKKLFAMIASFIFLYAPGLNATIIHMSLINKSNESGNFFLYGPDYAKGPFLLKVIGYSAWNFKPPHDGSMLAGLSTSIGHPISECELIDSGGFLALDFDNYKGDMITITFLDTPEGSKCTCTGSACSEASF